MNEYSSLAYGYRSYEQYTKKENKNPETETETERKEECVIRSYYPGKKIIMGQLTFSSTFDVNKTSVLLHAIE